MFRKNILKIKKLSPHAVIPKYNHETDAGLDFFSSEDVMIAPGERKAVRTGIVLALPADHVGLIWDRSGLALKGGLTTLGGVIDEEYRGEVMIILLNFSTKYYQIKRHDRIAQLLVQAIARPGVEIVEELNSTKRGNKGMGASGK